jgi:diaminopimelate decarboxylase
MISEESKIEIKICEPDRFENLRLFHERYLSPNNKNLYSAEFSCPIGLRAAVKRKEVIIALEGINIVGMARFYLTKRHGHASLYQFAIDEHYRGTGLLKRMLSLISAFNIVCRCPLDLSLNSYFSKLDWKLKTQDNRFNYWCFEADIQLDA